MFGAMAFLDNLVALMVTASLGIQIIVLFLLIYGYLLKRRLKFRQHGLVMASAVILHLIMVLYIMIPSFVYAVVPDYIVAPPLELTSIVGLIHGILGSIALTLGVWLVAAWRFQKSFNGCFSRKKLMIRTLIVWVSALAFGIILYSIFIGPLLMI
jgi:hypothetical protein